MYKNRSGRVFLAVCCPDRSRRRHPYGSSDRNGSFAKNADQPLLPGQYHQNTYIALIVLETLQSGRRSNLSHDDVSTMWKPAAVLAGIDEGDVLTVRDCLYALMLASANESANALACHVSGSREAFAELMNQTAESLGCTGSHFANPSGLNDENHYTTAHDMALIARAAIQNPDFLEIGMVHAITNCLLPKRVIQKGICSKSPPHAGEKYFCLLSGSFAGKPAILPLQAILL